MTGVLEVWGPHRGVPAEWPSLKRAGSWKQTAELCSLLKQQIREEGKVRERERKNSVEVEKGIADPTVTEYSVNQTLISNTYLVSIIKMSIKWERVIYFSSATQSFSFSISQLMLHSDHSCTFFMENVQNSIKY